MNSFVRNCLFQSTFVYSKLSAVTEKEEPTKMEVQLFEGVSGETGLVLPEYMGAMSKDQLRDIFKDPTFGGSPEWQELVELNPNRQRQARKSKRREQ